MLKPMKAEDNRHHPECSAYIDLGGLNFKLVYGHSGPCRSLQGKLLERRNGSFLGRFRRWLKEAYENCPSVVGFNGHSDAR